MTNLASIPDAAIGAMVAACIGGFISFVGLVISKEMKTSDFRQAWIDALREDIAQMLAHVNLVRAVLVTHPTKDLERFAALSERACSDDIRWMGRRSYVRGARERCRTRHVRSSYRTKFSSIAYRRSFPVITQVAGQQLKFGPNGRLSRWRREFNS